jgi:prepilin signal peptidase PulO-like enzyme (type II secretory pathway)
MLLVAITLLVLGLVFGSFATALSWRIPQEIPFVKGRSVCPKCKSQIAWYDNIPLLSYLILGGKCRHCRERISLRYPLIELTGAVGFLLIGLATLPDYVRVVYYLIIFFVLLLIFVIDLEKQIIPDILVFFGVFIVFIYSLFFAPKLLYTNLISGFLAAAFLMLIHLFTRGKGMGLGDVKFAVFGGMFIGLPLLPIWFLLAFLTGGVTGSILILLGLAKMKTKIAFGPFLVIGLALATILGERIIYFLVFS